MDFGGIIAGAMQGGGQALRQNAQGQLEQQRQEALQRLEQDFRMDVVDREQTRADQRAVAEAEAERNQMMTQAQLDEQAAIRDSQLAIAEDAASQATEARLDGSSTSGRTLEDVMEARDRELSARIESEIDRMRSGVLPPEDGAEIDRAAIAREVTRQYADLYPEYSDRLMRGIPEPSNDGRGRSGGNNDPLGIR